MDTEKCIGVKQRLEKDELEILLLAIDFLLDRTAETDKRDKFKNRGLKPYFDIKTKLEDMIQETEFKD